jgi:hypothetical protein
MTHPEDTTRHGYLVLLGQKWEGREQVGTCQAVKVLMASSEWLPLHKEGKLLK